MTSITAACTLAWLVSAPAMAPAPDCQPPSGTEDLAAWTAALDDPSRREEAEYRLICAGSAAGAALGDAIRVRLDTKRPCDVQIRALIVLGRDALDAMPALVAVFARGSRREQAMASHACLALHPFVDSDAHGVVDALVKAHAAWDQQMGTVPRSERTEDVDYYYAIANVRGRLGNFGGPGLKREFVLSQLTRNSADHRVPAAVCVLENAMFSDEERWPLITAALEAALAVPRDPLQGADGFEWTVAGEVLRRRPQSAAAADDVAELCWRAIAATHPNSWCRADAVAGLGRRETPTATAALARSLHDRAQRVVVAAIDALATKKEWWRATRALDDLILFGDDLVVRAAARRAVCRRH